MTNPYGPAGQPYPQQPHYGPPQGQPQLHPQQYGYQQPPQFAPVEPRNGLGLAALICSIIGVLCAVVPIAFIVGGPLAIVGTVLGFAASGRVRRGVANNMRVANLASAIGIIAIILAASSAYKVYTAVDRFNDTVNEINQISKQRQQECLDKAITIEDMAACGK